MRRILTVAAAVLALSTGAALAEGDPVKGEKVFKKCKSCHMVGPEAKNRVGPPLNGVVDAPWGRYDSFKYSKPLKEMAADGRAWDEATLDAYLKKPKDVIPRGRMAFAGLRREAQRADVIAYLRQFAENGTRTQ